MFKRSTRNIISELFVPFAGLVFLFLFGWIVSGKIMVGLMLSGVVSSVGVFVVATVWLNEKVRDWAMRGDQ